MKQRVFILSTLVISLFTVNLHAEGLSLFAGAVYNPLTPDYIMGSLVFERFMGSGNYKSTHAAILETRLSFGSLTYKWEAANPFTVENETTEFWVKGGVFEVAMNVIYQYAFTEIVGLRFGFGLTSLWGGMFSGNKVGLTGNGNPLSLTMGFYGIAGVSIFPQKRFPIVVSVSPGVVMDDYGANGLFPFNLPISVMVGWNAF